MAIRVKQIISRTMKKTYIKPATEIVELTLNCAMLAGSMKKNSESVTDEKDVLSRGTIWDDDEEDY